MHLKECSCPLAILYVHAFRTQYGSIHIVLSFSCLSPFAYSTLPLSQGILIHLPFCVLFQRFHPILPQPVSFLSYRPHPNPNHHSSAPHPTSLFLNLTKLSEKSLPQLYHHHHGYHLTTIIKHTATTHIPLPYFSLFISLSLTIPAQNATQPNICAATTKLQNQAPVNCNSNI